MTYSRRDDIMRKELRRQTLAAAPGLQECIWSPFQGQRPARPFAEWRPIVQPTSPMSTSDDVETLELPRQVDVQVLSALDGQPYRLEFNYASVTSTAGPASTVTTVRDDLVTKVNADSELVTAAAVSTDILRLTAGSAGSLWRVDSVASLMALSATVGSPVDIVNLQRAALQMTASLNIYSADVNSGGDASSYGHMVDSAFRKPRVAAELSQMHMAVTRIADPVNLDNLPPSGTAFESRVATDYSIYFPYWDAEVIGEIETCEVTVNTDRGSIQFTA